MIEETSLEFTGFSWAIHHRDLFSWKKRIGFCFCLSVSYLSNMRGIHHLSNKPHDKENKYSVPGSHPIDQMSKYPETSAAETSPPPVHCACDPDPADDSVRLSECRSAQRRRGEQINRGIRKIVSQWPFIHSVSLFSCPAPF